MSEVKQEGDMTRSVQSIARRVLVGSALLGVAVTAALAPVALAADHGVDIAGFAFSPQSITVSVGDSVTWTNADAQGHTATADDASFDTGTIANNASKSVTFDTAGTFAYHCKIHPQMTATVVVEDAAAGTPPATDVAARLTPPDPGASDGRSLLLLVFAGLAGLVGGATWRRGVTRGGGAG
jgi:plastocyanin